jgi:hypothetical protein
VGNVEQKGKLYKYNSKIIQTNVILLTIIMKATFQENNNGWKLKPVADSRSAPQQPSTFQSQRRITTFGPKGLGFQITY